MARGTTLAEVVAMLKAEIGDFAGSNQLRDDQLRMLVSNKQRWLATEYDWPFLERFWNVDIPGQQQFANFPNVDSNTDSIDINLERFPTVEVLWNNVYQPVDYGIGADEYNTFNFAFGQSSDPIQRWRVATNPNEPTNPNAFEVWPVPTTMQTIRFTGQRALQIVLADSDTLDLDDMLVVYFVAAELLKRHKQLDWQEKMQLAQRRLVWTRQNYPVREVKRCLGGLGGDAEFKRERRLIGMTIAMAAPHNP